MARLPKWMRKDVLPDGRVRYRMEAPDVPGRGRIRDVLGYDYDKALRKGKIILQGDELPSNELTIKKFGSDWLNLYVKKNRNDQGYKDAKQRFNRFTVKYLGHMALSQIKRKDLRRFAAWLDDRGLSNQTANHILGDLRCLLNFGVDEEHLDAAPSFRKILHKMPKPESKRLTDGQVRRILEVVSPVAKLLAGLTLLTGARRRELTNLKWNDVFLAVSEPYAELRKTKSKKPRKVFLPPEGVEILKELCKVRVRKRQEYVSPLAYHSICNIYKRSREELGFTWTWHQLRHTFASRFREQGGDSAVLKELLGHSTITLTERYSSLGENAVAANVQRVNLSTFGQDPRQSEVLEIPKVGEAR